MTGKYSETIAGMLAAAHRRNGIACWPLLAIGLLTAGEIALGFSDPAFLPLLVLAPVVAAAFLALFVWDMFASLWLRKWVRAGSLLLLPLFVCGLWRMPQRFNENLNYVGQRLHLFVETHKIEEALARLPDDGKRYLVLDWAGWGGINTFLIFDETDRTALPAAQREECPALSRSHPDCVCDAVHFTGHYYFCSI